MVTPLTAARLADGRKLTQQDVATGSQIDRSHYSRIEAGEVRPSADVAERIAAFLRHAVSEMQILYPERYAVAEHQPAGEAA